MNTDNVDNAENVTTLTCAKIQRKVLMFGDVGAPESFWDKNYMTLGSYILWILNKPRFHNWFKGQKDGKISNFCQIS